MSKLIGILVSAVVVLLLCGVGVYFYLQPTNIHIEPMPPKPEPMVEITPKWVEYPPVRQVTNREGKLNDLESHLPKGHPYGDNDRVTNAHEDTHGINSYIRMKYANQGKINAFYCFDNKAVVLPEPNTTLSEIAKVVPRSMRGLMYKNYVINMQSKKVAMMKPDPKLGVCKTLCSKMLRGGGWNNEPLYLIDEFSAYTNGSETGIDLAANGKWKWGRRAETVQFMMEFNNLSLCLVYKVDSKDADFKSFMQWQITRAVKLCEESKKYPDFTSGSNDEPLKTLQTASDAAELRSYIKKYFGEKWTLSVLGF